MKLYWFSLAMGVGMGEFIKSYWLIYYLTLNDRNRYRNPALHWYVLFGSISLHSVVYWMQLFEIMKALYMVLKRVQPVVIGLIKQMTS